MSGRNDSSMAPRGSARYRSQCIHIFSRLRELSQEVAIERAGAIEFLDEQWRLFLSPYPVRNNGQRKRLVYHLLTRLRTWNASLYFSYEFNQLSRILQRIRKHAHKRERGAARCQRSLTATIDRFEREFLAAKRNEQTYYESCRWLELQKASNMNELAKALAKAICEDVNPELRHLAYQWIAKIRRTLPSEHLSASFIMRAIRRNADFEGSVERAHWAVAALCGSLLQEQLAKEDSLREEGYLLCLLVCSRFKERETVELRDSIERFFAADWEQLV